MATDYSFFKKIDQMKDEVSRFQYLAQPDIIEKTAARLERLNYAPALIIPVSVFLRLTPNALLGEIDKILAIPDQEACALAPDNPQKCQDLRLQFISVLVFYYKQLDQLRQGNPDAWDEVDEVYVHD